MSEINAFLEERRGRAPRLEDMARPDAPDVYDDTDAARSDPFWDVRGDPFNRNDPFTRNDPWSERDRRF